MKNNPILHQKLAVSCDIEYENIKDLFLTQMQKTPNKIFLIIHGDKKEQFTYLEFKNIIFKTINFMKTKNLKKNDIISLIFHNSSEFLILYFAGLFYGLTIVPINPDMSSREIEYIIRNSNSKIVFYNHTLESKIVLVQKNLKEKNYLQIHTIHELTSSFDDEIEFNSENVDLLDNAVIIYTSGTTGNPKGVILSHLNLLSDSMSISQWFEFNEKTRCLCILPLFHNNGQITTLLAPLYSGGSTVIVKGKVSLFAFWFLVNEYGVTWTSFMS